MNLPLLSSVLTVIALYFIGKKRWWGHLFGVANCVVFTVIALTVPGQWGFIPANLVCGWLYIHNARKWKRTSTKV